MTHFSPDFIAFFKKLAANNHTEWFHANKKRYEKSVKEPFLQFVTHFIQTVQTFDNTVTTTPQKAIFRINRDVRFAADKSPYKIHASAAVESGPRSDWMPGFYFELSPEWVRIYSGIYLIDKDRLYQLRTYLAQHTTAFLDIINNPEFKKTYKNLLGERNVRIPPEFKDTAVRLPEIANKQFYVMTEYPPTLIEKETLLNTLIQHYQVALPFKNFLLQALKTS